MDLRQKHRAFHEVNMAVDESRQYQVLMGVENMGVWPALGFNLFLVADRRDLAAANGNGLCPWLARVHRVHLGVCNDDVGRPCGSRTVSRTSGQTCGQAQ